MNPTKNIFAIYASQDSGLALNLMRRMKSLENDFDIAIWHDDPILPGQHWKPQDATRLNQADIFLLLVSDAFMHSEFIKQDEFKIIIDRYKAGKTIVIPILLDHCPWDINFNSEDYNFNFKELRVLPKGEKPISAWNLADQPLKHVTDHVKEVISSIAENLGQEKPNENLEKHTGNTKEEQIALSFTEEREANDIAAKEKRLGEEAETRKRLEEEKLLREEAETKRKTHEENKLREEADTIKRVEEEKIHRKEADAKRVVQEENRLRMVTEAKKRTEEEKKLREQAEPDRVVQEEMQLKEQAEAKKREEEEKRLKEETEAKRIANKEEQAVEAEALKRAKEENRLKEEAVVKRRTEAEKRLKEEAETKKLAEEEKKLKDEAEIKRRAKEAKWLGKEVEANKNVVEESSIAEEVYLSRQAADTHANVEEETTEGRNNRKKGLLKGFLVAATVIAGIWAFSIFSTDSEKNSSAVPDMNVTKVDSNTTDNTKTDSGTQAGAVLKLGIGDRYKGDIIFTIDSSNKTGKIAHLKDAGPMPWKDAMNIHEQLGEGWRLPTLAELQLMQKTIGQGATNSGKFADELYWSATPYDENQARLVRFIDGNTTFHYNSVGTFRKFRVRAIRDFVR